jgi:TPR repeat protein
MAWSWQERGFPAQRSWRPWGAPEAPAWAGLRDHTLWIELRGGRALALDPSTGGILQVRAAIPHARPAKTDYQRALDEDQAEWGDPNYQEALRRLEEKAASGALEDLLAALEHLRSMGPEAERRAFPWLLKAAETGHPRSMLQVGVAYFHGVVVKADPGAAERWLDRAARAGDPQAAEVKALLSLSPR